MKKVMFIQALLLTFVACLIAAASCNKVETIEEIVEVPVYPDLEGIKVDTLKAVSADLAFYGAYSEDLDRWYLTLCTENGMEYDLATDTYSGKGSVVILCLQTKISKGSEADIPVITGRYTAPEAYEELKRGQYETGFERQFDHPFLGTLNAKHGSFYVNLDDSNAPAIPLMDGSFEINRLSNGNYRVYGTMVDATFIKRRFFYEGPIDKVSEYDFPGAPDSVLPSDVSLSKDQLPIVQIRDKGDQYKYNDTFRNYRVYLTGPDVKVSEIKSIVEKVKLSGHGPVVLLDLFVSPDADGRIPAGEYQLTPREYNYALAASNIVPFRFVAGYPGRYSDPQGCWYFNLGEDGHWTGDYGMIVGGTLKVSYDEKGELVIDGDFLDCAVPQNKIQLSLK